MRASSWWTRGGLLAALIGLAGGLWYTGRPEWRTRRLLAQEATRFREAGGPAPYIQDTRRYLAYRRVVETGAPAVEVLLPALQAGEPAERFVAAAMLGTLLRQARAETVGSRSAEAGPLDERTVREIVAGLTRLRAGCAADSYLARMIARDLAHGRRE